MQLRLRVRCDCDGVDDAVDSVKHRLPEGWPAPTLFGRILCVPYHPDVIWVLAEELETRGLKFLAARVTDPVRWRGR